MSNDDYMDFSDLDPAARRVEIPEPKKDFGDLPDGKYQVKVDGVALKRIGKDSKRALIWKLVVLTGGFAGYEIIRTNFIETELNIKWLYGDLAACGLDMRARGLELSQLQAHLAELLDVRINITRKTKGDNVNIYFNGLISLPPKVQTGGVSAPKDALSKEAIDAEAARLAAGGDIDDDIPF